MPYPVVHVLFFVLCISIVAIFTATVSIYRRELSLNDLKIIIISLVTGSYCALLPDIAALYSFFFKSSFEHYMIGPIATHSLLFSSSAILLGTITGYILYGKYGKAIYLGLLCVAAFLSHLILDDLWGGGCPYFYPITYRKFAIFNLINVDYNGTDFLQYLVISFVSVFSLGFVIILTLFSLKGLGFEFIYKSK